MGLYSVASYHTQGDAYNQDPDESSLSRFLQQARGCIPGSSQVDKYRILLYFCKME
jgi:hypothetical protein